MYFILMTAAFLIQVWWKNIFQLWSLQSHITKQFKSTEVNRHLWQNVIVFSIPKVLTKFVRFRV